MAEVFKLDHVYKNFKNDGKEFLALEDVSLSINEGEIFGIIGMSGAGKSTLVRTLNRLEDVTDGKVSFYDKNLADLKATELRLVRRQIAMIFQSFNLLGQRSVLSNVMQPLRIAGVPRSQRKEKALEMLRVVGLEDKKNEYPARLSGGQRQRVAIARALAADPKVLLCDEATSALDSISENAISEALEVLMQNRTSIVIAHRLSTIMKAEKIVVIADGQVAELGTHQELLEKNGIYRDLYETQFRQVLDMQGLEEKELEWEGKNMVQNDVY